MFIAPRKQKTTIFTVFFAPDSKKHGIYSVFWPGPRKTLEFTQFSACSKNIFFLAKGTQNNVNYTIFALGKQQKNSQNPPKSDQNAPPKRSF